MKTFIIIEDIITGTKRSIEFDSNHREIYEEEITELYMDKDIDVVIVYDEFGNSYYISKQMAQKYLITIKMCENEISN